VGPVAAHLVKRPRQRWLNVLQAADEGCTPVPFWLSEVRCSELLEVAPLALPHLAYLQMICSTNHFQELRVSSTDVFSVMHHILTVACANFGLRMDASLTVTADLTGYCLLVKCDVSVEVGNKILSRVLMGDE
jgi:hypothetical protein